MAVPLIRTSERGDFKACQFYWYHHWVNGLGVMRVPTWSWFGTAWHAAMEARYQIGLKRGSLADMIDAFKASAEGEQRRVYLEGGELDDQEVVDGLELGIAMLRAYVAHWGRDVHWHVLHTESPFQVDVRHPTTGRLIAIYCGTWDLAVWDRADKVYRIVDHKTRKSFPKDWSFYELNDQGGSYLWVAPEVLRHKGIIGDKDELDGIVFSMARKALPQPTAEDGVRYNLPKKSHYVEALRGFLKTDSNHGKPWEKHTLPELTNAARFAGLEVRGEPRAVQPAPAFHRHTTYRNELQRVKQGLKVIDEARHMDLVRRGRLPLLKSPREECVRCSLFDFCQLDERDPQEAQEYAATMLVRRDPYADHRRAIEAYEQKEK